MNKTDLHSRIDLYFDAQLSAAQEEELYEMLLAADSNDVMVKEALAVMVMSRMRGRVIHKDKARPRRQPGKRRLRFAAAVVGVLLAVGGASMAGYLLSDRNVGASGEMVAFVGGIKIENRSVIMNIVDSQLSDIGESSDFIDFEIASDLEDIKQALSNDEI